jgi:hypothetical protein
VWSRALLRAEMALKKLMEKLTNWSGTNLEIIHLLHRSSFLYLDQSVHHAGVCANSHSLSADGSIRAATGQFRQSFTACSAPTKWSYVLECCSHICHRLRADETPCKYWYVFIAQCNWACADFCRYNWPCRSWKGQETQQEVEINS